MKPVKTLLTVLLWTMMAFSVSAQPTYFNSATSVTDANEPFNTSTDQRAQWLYLASDFPTAHSSDITDIYLRTNATGSTTYSLTDVNILLGETTNTTIGTTWNGSLTNVYTSAAATVTVLTGGWIKFTLSTPFTHDKTKNLIVEASCTSSGTGLTLAHNSASATGRLYGTAATTTPTADAALADFGFDLACPNITAQPSNVTLCAGGNLLFGVDVTNTTSFQWQVNTGSGFSNITNGAPYSGATTDTLRITGATAGMNSYVYRVVTTHGTCDVRSDEATLTVNTKPAITTQPVDAHACPGDNAVISVVGTGTNVAYRWKVDMGAGFINMVDDATYNGTLTNTLNITGATQAMHGYKYRVQLTGTCPSALNSDTVALVIDTLPVVTVDPVDSTICPATNATFNITAIGTNAAYRWQVDDGNGFVNLSNGGVYSGVRTNKLLITSAPFGMDGYKYRCVVSGQCKPNDTSAAAELTVNEIPTIVSHPVDVTVCPGSTASFSALGKGTGVTYQWKVFNGTTFSDVVNNATYSGAQGPVLTITGATLAMNGLSYSVVISGTCPPSSTLRTNGARLTVSSTLNILDQPDSTTTCEHVATQMSVSLLAANMNYQWEVSVAGGAFTPLSDGANYSGTTDDTLHILNPLVSLNGNKYRCVLNNNCSGPVPTDTVALTVLAAPVITADPANVHICEGGTTTFSVTATGAAVRYQWQLDDGSGFTNIPNAYPYTGQFGATMTILNPLPDFDGYKYRCIVSGTCSPNDTSAVATLNVDAKPFIITEPSDAVICNGDDAIFGLEAGGLNATYQWQERNSSGTWTNIVNGGRYSGALTDTLTLSSPTVAMNGNNYRCVVTGTCVPSKNSATVTLFVNTPPTIYIQPDNKTACETFGTDFKVSVSASGSTPIKYQWLVDDGTGFVAVVDNSVYSGSNTATLTLSNIVASMDNYQYKCDVSTPCSPASTSTAGTLTVQLLPKVTTQPFDVTICPTTNTTFSVAATGTNLSYQWEVDMGSGFVRTPSLPNYVGANSNTLSIMSATTSMNGYKFRCIVSGSCPSAKSNSAILNVLNPATILTYTPSVNTCEGTNTILSVTASGTALQYQWQKKDATGTYSNINNVPPFSGTNTATLTISGTPASLDANMFRCYVFETAICNLGYFTGDIPFSVTPAPASTPSQLTTAFFSSATFTVTPTGTTYQWQENKNDGGGYRILSESANYQGVKTNTLTVSPVSYVMSGFKYRCLIGGLCTVAIPSTVSTLIVDPALSVDNVAKNSNLNMNVFPNPLSGTQLNVRFDKALKGNTQVRVMDKLGKLVYSGKLDINGQNTATVELQQLATGIYMLQVVNEAESFDQTIQFTKQ